MRIIVFAISIILLGACSTELTTQGAEVRPISQAFAQSCRFIGTATGVESLGLDIAGDVQSATNQVRNQVGDMGGNSYVVNQTDTSAERTIVVAEAYLC